MWLVTFLYIVGSAYAITGLWGLLGAKVAFWFCLFGAVSTVFGALMMAACLYEDLADLAE